MRDERVYTPLTQGDITRIAKYLNMSEEEFIMRFVALSLGRMFYEGAPEAIGCLKGGGACPFLRQGLCGINPVKPKICKEYVPKALDAYITCAMWHKARLSWM